MTTTRGTAARTVAGVLAAAALLGGVLWLAGGERALARLAAADPWPVLVGVLAAVLALLAWSEVLAGLLRTGAADPPGGRDAAGSPDAGGASGRELRLAYLGGDFAKQILPMGHASGPVLMALAVRRSLGTEYDRTLAVVTATELLGLVASLLLAAVGLAALALVGPVPGLPALAGTVAAALLAVGLLVGLLRYDRGLLARVGEAAARVVRGTAGRVVGRLGTALVPGAVTVGIERYHESLSVATADRRALARAAAFATLGWGCYVLPLYTAALALDTPISPWLAAFAVPVAGLATWLPVPGGTGGVEAVLSGLLVLLAGLSVPVAVAVAFLYRLSVYWFVLPLTGAAAALLFVRDRRPD